MSTFSNSLFAKKIEASGSFMQLNILNAPLYPRSFPSCCFSWGCTAGSSETVKVNMSWTTEKDSHYGTSTKTLNWIQSGWLWGLSKIHKTVFGTILDINYKFIMESFSWWPKTFTCFGDDWNGTATLHFEIKRNLVFFALKCKEKGRLCIWTHKWLLKSMLPVFNHVKIVMKSSLS